MGYGGPHAAYIACREEVQATASRADHRRIGRPPRQPRAPDGAADARAAYPAGEGHLQHLHRAGPARGHGGDVRRLPRSRGTPADRGTHPQAGGDTRRTALREAGCELLHDSLLRHPARPSGHVGGARSWRLPREMPASICATSGTARWASRSTRPSPRPTWMTFSTVFGAERGAAELATRWDPGPYPEPPSRAPATT